MTTLTDPQIDDDNRIDDARKAVDREYLVLGRELYMAFETGKYKADGQTLSFDDYAAKKGVDPARAKRFRRVFKKYSKELGVSFPRMLELGYEKLKAIEPVIRRGNRDLWLHRAQELDYSALIKEVALNKPKRARRVEVKQDLSDKTRFTPEDSTALLKMIVDDRLKPSVDGEVVADDSVVIVRKLYLVAEQNQVFDTAIENMERRTGSTKVGYLLTSALEEFLAHEATRNLKDDDRLKYFMGVLERRYKVKLLSVRDKKVAAKLAELISKSEEAVDQDQACE